MLRASRARCVHVGLLWFILCLGDVDGLIDKSKHDRNIISPRKTRSKNKPGTTIALRPRYKIPYVPTDTSKDEILDMSINNKNRDETYIPTKDDCFDDTAGIDSDMNTTIETTIIGKNRDATYTPTKDDCFDDTAGLDPDINTNIETTIHDIDSIETYVPNEDVYLNSTDGIDFDDNSNKETSTNDKIRNVLNEDDCINATAGIGLKMINTLDNFINDKNMDKIYIPTEHDYKTVPTEYYSDCPTTLTQQISESSFQTTTNILADDSYNSFIQNSHMMQSTQVHDDVYNTPSEIDESYNFTNNNTKSTEALRSTSYEQTTTTAPAEPAAISLPPRPNYEPSSDILNSPSGTISEYDDSDRDVTFNPTTKESSSDSSDNEEPVDSSSDTEHQIRPERDGFERHQDLAIINEEEDTVAKTPKKPRIRSKDFCYFCETNVLNFARHIIRNHTLEPEVQNILSLPTKSNTRKSLFTALRKKGNYIANFNKCVKPMKKSNIYPDIDYLPCEQCLGFYSRKQLWKHKKKCQPSSSTSSAQADAQNFMLRNLNVDKKLKNEVFSKMRPDRVSLEAKKDPLICAFAAQYIRSHREKHYINVTSRKMRELAKLLIELKKLTPSIKNLMDCLKPQNYEFIVTAAKTIASYDDKKDRYGAPTYAMNISTSLKQCCNIAIMSALKSGSSVQTAQMEADFKTLIQVIEANWKFDVSSQACNDLNLKKWNKVTVVPLASDLKTLKEHLCEKAKTAATKLSETEICDIEAYNCLLETIYCRVLLLNRRRPGELQRLLLSTYQECNNANTYEEFDRAISNAEKMLMKNFKRVVIRGKRSRGVPVLFTDDVQSDIDLLVTVRHKYIPAENNYLFAKPGCETSLCGYKVLEKYAKSCGAKNPKAITATKLRKHLATLTQMLNLKDSDIEQLANFMGHTQSVHRQNYRLPDDVYQTAKISKLLLLMEDGNADVHKGKALDEIELDLDQDLLQETRDENNDCDDLEYDNVISTEQPTVADTVSETPEVSHLRDVTNMKKITLKKKRTLVPWTSQQKNLVMTFFSKHIKSKRPPKRHECEELRSSHPEILHNKDWLKIKVFIQNTYSKK